MRPRSFSVVSFKFLFLLRIEELILLKFYPSEVAPHISDKGVLVAFHHPNSQKNCQSMEVLFLPTSWVSSFQKLQILSVFVYSGMKGTANLRKANPTPVPKATNPA